MKNKKFLILTLIFISGIIFANEDYTVKNIYENDLINFELKGKVKSINQKFGFPGNDLINFKDLDEKKSMVLEFNKSGYCKSVKYFVDSPEYVKKNVYTYKDNGTKRTGFYIYNQEKNCIFKKIFTYNESGKIVKVSIYYPQKSNRLHQYYRWEYSRNKLVKKTLYNRSDKELGVINLEYSLLGKLKSESPCEINSDKSNSFKYDTFNNLIESIKYNDGYKVIKKYIYKKGLLNFEYTVYQDKIVIQEYSYNKNKTLKSVIKYNKNMDIETITRFKYDNYGNYIKKAIFSPSSNGKMKMTAIYIRDIKYY